MAFRVVFRGAASIMSVASIDRILKLMESNPKGVRFSDLMKVCRHYFGEPRTTGGDHVIFRTPWPGDPRVNIQNDRGNAKAYQVRQVMKAVDRMERYGKEPDHE